jgi:hypothetical protein
VKLDLHVHTTMYPLNLIMKESHNSPEGVYRRAKARGMDVRVYLGVLGVTEEQHREIQGLRFNVAELLPYLKQERIFTTLNHVASRVNGEITAPHIALMPWVDGIEIRNGSRLPEQNQTAECLADACPQGRSRSFHPRRAFQSRTVVRSRQAAGSQGS